MAILHIHKKINTLLLNVFGKKEATVPFLIKNYMTIAAKQQARLEQTKKTRSVIHRWL